MSLLIEKLYIRFIPKSKNNQKWYSLVLCDDCQKERAIPKHHALNGNQQHWCQSCKTKGKRNFWFGKGNKFKGEKNYFYNKKHSQETKKILSDFNKELYKDKTKHGCFGKEGNFKNKQHSQESKLKIKEAQKTCNKKIYRGPEHYKYNHSLTQEEREKKRHFSEYAPWRLAIYKKDKYSCQICQDNKGGNLNAHHLDGWNWAKDKRFDIDNGVCLCDDCHEEFHDIYGWGDNTKTQYYQFKSTIFNGYC